MPEAVAALENALRRVTTPTDGDGAAVAGLSGSRRAIVDHLLGAGRPQTVEQISEAVGLHVNTTRHHLDVLEACAAVERHSARPKGRGRPKVLFLPSRSMAEPYQELQAVLERALQSGDPDEIAAETARTWVRNAPRTVTADNPDAAVTTAVDALVAAGFAAHSDEVGDTITVSSCPYASLIAEHPMICTIHAELMQSLLERTGQPVSLSRFDVWVRPGVCRAVLERADATPEFTARPSVAPSTEEDR